MLYSNKALIKMAVPLFIQQVLAITIGMIDTMMVSSAGEAAVSGVSLVNSLDQMLVIIFSSITIGGTVVVSQFFGARDEKAARGSAKQLLYAAVFMACCVTLFSQIFRNGLLFTLFGDVEADVMQSASDYFFYVSLSFPMLAISSSCEAIRRVEGKTAATTIVLVFANLLNVSGNAVLIFGFGMGAAGAAIATLVSRSAAAITLLVLSGQKNNVLRLERLFHYKPDFPVIRKILRIGIPNGIENGMLNLGRLLTQSLIATLPTTMIAANAVANSLANYQYMPGTALSGVMIPVVGRCIGAQKQDEARYYTKKLMLWTYISLWVVATATFFGADLLIGGYELAEQSAKLAKQLICYHLVMEVILWPIGFTLPNAFRAAGDVKITMVVSVLSLWLFRICLSYFLVLPEVSILGLTLPGMDLGVMGVWVAMTIDWVFRVSIYIPHFFREKWLKKASLAD